jgi:hypothetical protein
MPEKQLDTVMGGGKIVDGDAALQYLNNWSSTPMTPEDEKKLLRKLDMKLIPLMC